MKYLSLSIALTVLAALASIGTTHAWATYNDSVDATQTASPDGIAVNLTASGDLPGMGQVKLQANGANVTGGTWSLTVLPPNADASSIERGKVTGIVTGGTVTLNADGTLASATSVQLTLQSGTGEYANVTTGTGTISLTSSAENPSQLSGSLVLNF